MNTPITNLSPFGPIPIVSWLLCTNKCDHLLERAIESCLRQTFTEFELIIIVNGASVESITNKLKNRYAGEHSIRIFSTPIHLLNFSLSFGLHLARGKYIARMDSDDVSDPARLEQQVSFMNLNPKVIILGSAYKLIDESGNYHGLVTPPMSNSEIRNKLFYKNPLCHPSVMMRTKVVQELGGYLGGKYAEDFDLWLRVCLESNYEFANLDQFLLSYNVSQSGDARKSRVAYANTASAQLRNFLISGNYKWALGAILSFIKSILLAKKK